MYKRQVVNSETKLIGVRNESIRHMNVCSIFLETGFTYVLRQILRDIVTGTNEMTITLNEAMIVEYDVMHHVIISVQWYTLF